MDTRETIETLLDAAYAARQRQDHEAAAACFTEDGCFKANGSLGTASRAEQHAALKATCSASPSTAGSSTRRGRSCTGAGLSGPKAGRWATPTSST
jgi:hypothetical protein